MAKLVQQHKSEAAGKALIANAQSTTRSFAKFLEVIDTDIVLQSISEVDYPLFNMVMHLQLDELSELDDILLPYRERNNRSILFLFPNAHPTNISSYAGMTLIHERPCMAIHTSQVSYSLPDNFKITLVKDEQDIEAWVSVQSQTNGGFEEAVFQTYTQAIANTLANSSNQRAFIGWENDSPVASSLLILEAGVAGIYQVATIEQVRGKGYGRAMTGYPLTMASHAGYEVGILMATEMGFPLYEKMGFEKLFHANVHLFVP